VMENEGAVSVVIPCFNEEAYIGPCVESVIVSGRKSNKKFKVIVVDGQSDDRTPQLLEQLQVNYTELIVLENPDRVTPISLNIGIKYANSGVVIILGAHSKVNENFISMNLEVLNENPTADCVGGVIKNTFDGKSGELFEKALTSSFGVGNARFRTGGEAGFVDTVAFGAYRKRVFESIGYFDERLARNQDDEFNFRLLKAGMKIFFDPRIQSNYFIRTELKKLGRQYHQYGYWKVYVNVLHRQVTTWRQLAPVLLVTSILAYPVLVSLAIIYDSTWFSWPSVVIAVEMTLYFLLLLIVSGRHANSLWKTNKMMQIFWALHWNYGLGYLYGLVDFLILRKKPSSANAHNTR
jgi:glycosyltransferase involved in cell wall biosynthesis